VAIELSSRRGSREVISLKIDDSLSLTIDAVSKPLDGGAIDPGLETTENPEIDDAVDRNPPN
jgi:hypothetical protein